MKTEQRLQNYPVRLELPVIWGEMDAFAHVNNTVYFRYFENIRLAYLEQTGYMDCMRSTGIGPILAETRCRYRIPLTYPDTITVATRLLDLDEDRFTQDYAVFSHAHGKLAAQGEGLIVSYDYRANRKVRIPDTIREKMLALEPNLENKTDEMERP